MQITEYGAIVEGDSHIGQWVIENKRLDFDQNVLPVLLPYINDGDSVVDVGANIGSYAYAFHKKIGDKGMIYCFEPAKDSYECLKYNMVGTNIFNYNCALGATTSKVKIIRNTNNVGLTIVEECKDGEIDIVPLDFFQLEKCDFIKIDVEGYELDVLIGANDTIEKFKPIMFIEINTVTLSLKGLTQLDIFNWLNKKGYTFKNIYPNEQMKGSQYDIICIHNEKLQ